MIKLRNRQNEEFWLNEDLILRFKGEKDVIITLIDGESIGVNNSIAEVVKKITASRAFVLKAASELDYTHHPDLTPAEVS